MLALEGIAVSADMRPGLAPRGLPGVGRDVLRSVVFRLLQGRCAQQVRCGGDARRHRRPQLEQLVQCGNNRGMVERKNGSPAGFWGGRMMLPGAT